MAVKDNLGGGLQINDLGEEHIALCDNPDVKKGDLLVAYTGQSTNVVHTVFNNDNSYPVLLKMSQGTYLSVGYNSSGNGNSYSWFNKIYLLAYNAETGTIDVLDSINTGNITSPARVESNNRVVLKLADGSVLIIFIGKLTISSVERMLYVQRLTVDDNKINLGPFISCPINDKLHSKFSSTDARLPYLLDNDTISTDTHAKDIRIIDWYKISNNDIVLHVVAQMYYGSTNTTAVHNETFLIYISLDFDNYTVKLRDVISSGFGGCSYINSTYTATSTYLVPMYDISEQHNKLHMGYRSSGIGDRIYLVTYDIQSGKIIKNTNMFALDTNGISCGFSDATSNMGGLGCTNFYANMYNSKSSMGVYRDQIIVTAMHSTTNLYSDMYYVHKDNNEEKTVNFFSQTITVRPYINTAIQYKDGHMEMVNSLFSLGDTARAYYSIKENKLFLTFYGYGNVTNDYARGSASRFTTQMYYNTKLKYYNPSHILQSKSHPIYNDIGVWVHCISSRAYVSGNSCLTLHCFPFKIANNLYMPIMYSYWDGTTSSSSDRRPNRPSRFVLITDNQYGRPGQKNLPEYINKDEFNSINMELNFPSNIEQIDTDVIGYWDSINLYEPLINDLQYTVFGSTYSYQNKMWGTTIDTNHVYQYTVFIKVDNPLKVDAVLKMTKSNYASFVRDGNISPQAIAMSNQDPETNTVKVKFLI